MGILSTLTGKIRTHDPADDPGTAAEFIRVEDLVVSFRGRRILDGISMSLPHGRRIAITGPNGCGKTTLLRCISGAHTPDSGCIHVNGRPLRDYSVPRLSRELAVVSQFENMIDQVRVLDIVLLGCGVRRSNLSAFTVEDHERAMECLRTVGLGGSEGRIASTLSGGERQRVLVARALAQRSRGMLLDEPTNHLDMRYQHEVLQCIAREVGSQVVVLHDLNMVARYSDIVVILNEGRIAAIGDPGEVMTPELIQDVYGMDAWPVEVNEIRQFVFDTRTHYCETVASGSAGIEITESGPSDGECPACPHPLGPRSADDDV